MNFLIILIQASFAIYLTNSNMIKEIGQAIGGTFDGTFTP